MHLAGKSDPYVVVLLGKARKKSSVVKRTLDPVWNETFEFVNLSLRDLVGMRLMMQAYDYDGVTSRSDSLGELTVSLAYVWLPLGVTASLGELTMSLACVW